MELKSPSLELDTSITVEEFFNRVLGAALATEDLRTYGWVDRGGCVIRFRFQVESIDMATCFHSNPELQH